MRRDVCARCAHPMHIYITVVACIHAHLYNHYCLVLHARKAEARDRIERGCCNTYPSCVKADIKLQHSTSPQFTTLITQSLGWQVSQPDLGGSNPGHL